MAWIERLISLHDHDIGNIAAILLTAMLFAVSHFSGYEKRRDHRLLMVLLGDIGVYSLMDMIACAIDGTPGTAARVLLYLLDSALYLDNMLLGYGWVRFISFHLGHNLRKSVRYGLQSLITFGSVPLIINVFVPIVFDVDAAGCYVRGPLYPMYMGIAVIYLISTIVMYCLTKRNGGALKYFPVGMYIAPTVLGILLEWLLGSSMLGICNAIALSAVMASMQQEEVYRDRLTGLYNRAYMEEMKRRLAMTHHTFASGIMLDLNDFKSINDRFGHAEGDQALITAAGLIRDAVSSYGDVIRYAGDEFVVILNTWSSDELKDCEDRIRKAFEGYNLQSGKPYQLTASMGSACFNAETQTVNEFMNMIDRNMYENKRTYYTANGNGRRKQPASSVSCG